MICLCDNMKFGVVAFLLILRFFVSVTCSSLQVDVNQDTGDYSIVVNGEVWFHGGSTGFRQENNWFQSSDGTLLLAYSSNSSGQGIFGKFQEISLHWVQVSSINPVFVTTIRSYSDLEAVVFEQYWPRGATATTNNKDNTEVVSSFPSLSERSDSRFNYFTWYQYDTRPQIGRWDNPELTWGARGGQVLAIYDKDLNTIVMSPFSNYLLGNQAVSNSLGGIVACGLQGMVDNIPEGFVHSTLLVYSNGFSRAIKSWGDMLLTRGGKTRRQAYRDPIVDKLGYWTDNGAYYYYKTEPDKNYQDTMLDVFEYQKLLPHNYFQLDSWWYYKGINDGLKLWEPRPDIFPNGIGWLDSKMDNIPLILHNRYFSPDTDYAENFSFAIEWDNQMAIPLTKDAYLYMMNKAAGWGMVVYEQDWLNKQHLYMNITQNNTEVARNWMHNLNEAAEELDLTIQFCMALPSHALASTEMSRVTHMRASDDYQPGNSQWMIGHTSLLLWAVGLVPYKDNFWSTANQTGCPYGNCYEPNTQLQVLVAALSNGPVGVSDMIGGTDPDLVMYTATKDGTLLKADKPATPVDSTLIQFSDSNPPELWQLMDSETTLNEVYTWHYVLAAGLPVDYTLYPEDLGLAVDSNNIFVSFFENSSIVEVFDQYHPIEIHAMQQDEEPTPFQFFRTSPMFPNNWAILGIYDLGIHLEIAGVAGELITISFWTPSQNVESVRCVLPFRGVTTVKCFFDQCLC